MARKAKHDQTQRSATFICQQCRDYKCNKCMDIMRIALGFGTELCNCKRRGHSGEAADQQIIDPETGTVYGPGLRVTTEGDVLHGGHSDGSHVSYGRCPAGCDRCGG